MDLVDNTASWSWLRLQDTFPEPTYTLWGDQDIRWNSINQGGLGDCYYLTALENLANKNINSIKKLFLNTPTNGQRIYGF